MSISSSSIWSVTEEACIHIIKFRFLILISHFRWSKTNKLLLMIHVRRKMMLQKRTSMRHVFSVWRLLLEYGEIEISLIVSGSHDNDDALWGMFDLGRSARINVNVKENRLIYWIAIQVDVDSCVEDSDSTKLEISGPNMISVNYHKTVQQKLQGFIEPLINAPAPTNKEKEEPLKCELSFTCLSSLTCGFWLS